MSNLSERSDQALDNIRSRISILNQMLASSGNDEHIEVVPVVVQYKIGFRQKESSLLKPAEFDALLTELNLNQLKL